MKQKPLRRIVLALDNLVHFLVAMMLLGSALVILIRALPGFMHPDIHGMLGVLNNILLALIFMEILWPVVRFLKRAPFRINPFLYVGIMSSTRRILMIEAEHSVAAKVADHGAGHLNWNIALDLGVNVGVILVLSIALYLIGEREEAAYKPHDE